MSTFYSRSGASPPASPSRFPGYFPGQVPPQQPDFLVSNHGTLYLLEPLTDAAVAWVDDHLPADHQLWGSAVVVEHRYIRDIVAGIMSDGLVLDDGAARC
jgi:hypothetical protein